MCSMRFKMIGLLGFVDVVKDVSTGAWHAGHSFIPFHQRAARFPPQVIPHRAMLTDLALRGLLPRVPQSPPHNAGNLAMKSFAFLFGTGRPHSETQAQDPAARSVARWRCHSCQGP